MPRLTERRGSTNSEAMCPALPKLAPTIPGAARSSSNTGSAFAGARVSRGRADHASAPTTATVSSRIIPKSNALYFPAGVGKTSEYRCQTKVAIAVQRLFHARSL